MKNPHHWIWCNFMWFGQLSNLGVFEAFDLATIVQWSKKIIVDGRWAFWGWWKKKFNIWTCWIQKKWTVKICTYNVIYKQAPKKKPSYFYCSRAWCWGPAPPRILPTSRSKLEIFLRFTLGVRAQKTWGQLRAFLACCWSQVTTKCYNIDVRILINAGIWAPKVANWLLKLYPFFSLGVNTRLQSSALISNLGLIENIFFYFSLDPSVKPLGPNSTFAPIGMLNLGWTSALTPSVKLGLRLHLWNLLPLLLARNIEQLHTVPTIVMGTSLPNIYVF